MRILNVVNTPFELYYLSAVSYLLLERDRNLEIELLINKSIGSKITPEIRNLYSDIKSTQFPALAKNHYQTLKFRQYLREFNFNNIDILCISSFREFFANMLCKWAPQNIRLIALRMADQKLEELGNLKRNPVFSFFLNIKNFFFCYSLMDYKFRTDAKAQLEKNFIKYPYHRTISITDDNIGRRNNDWRLPPPFIALKKIYKKSKDKSPIILVAGERTPLFPEWGREHQKKYEEFLDYLRENFKNYKLYFKPRKDLTDSSKFNLKGFQVLSADIPFEEVCLRKNVVKVISVKSTSSKVGAYFRIPAYLLYPMFNLPQNSKAVLESYFDDMRSVIRVNKLEDLKKDFENISKNYNLEELSSLYWEAIVK